MNEIIKVNYDNPQRPVVSGRELHESLQIETPYKKWFDRMTEYGFLENKDFWTNLSESTGGRPSTDHMLTIPMAKELCMIQRTEIGRKFRQYFITIEEAWNSPEMIMQRALSIANANIQKLQLSINQLQIENEEMKPKATYYDSILQTKEAVAISQIAKDYGLTAQKLNKLLNELHIQYKVNKQWVLYDEHTDKGYTHSKTYCFEKDDGKFGSNVQTYWTQKGRKFIYDKLKQIDILPVMDRESN